MERKEFIDILIKRMTGVIEDYSVMVGGSEAQLRLRDGSVINIKITDITDCEFNFVNLKNHAITNNNSNNNTES